MACCAAAATTPLPAESQSVVRPAGRAVTVPAYGWATAVLIGQTILPPPAPPRPSA